MKIIFKIIAVAVTISILLSLIVVAPLVAQPLAPDPDLLWSYNTTYDVTDIATGDLNGDGKADVVAIEEDIRTLSAISGADGSPLWSDTSSGYAVAIGDITGDDQNEVIAGGYDADYSEPAGAFGSIGGYVINAYAANGTPLWSYYIGNEVHDIEIGDVDGDGTDDVVACNDITATNIYVIDGDGDDLPGWPVIDVGGQVVDLAVGQLDGEDGVDVAAIGESGQSTVYVYDSNGDLLWLDHDGSGCTVEIGDVDGDGDNEVVAPYYGSAPVPDGSFGVTSGCWVLAFDGDDGGEPLYSFFAAENKRITDIELGDLDGEPGVEIATITEADNATLFAVDIDNSSKQKMWANSISWDSSYYGESLCIGDVDRDYKNEVVAAHTNQNIWAFDGMDSDEDGRGDIVWGPYSAPSTVTDVEIGDLDGDGDQDVVFGTTSSSFGQEAVFGTSLSTTIYAVAKVEKPFTSTTGTGTIYIDSDPSTIINPTSVDPTTLPDEGKPNVSFPHGLFSFNIIGLKYGQTSTVTITLPDPLPVASEYWKYGPTQSNTTNHWYQLPMGDNDGDNVITIELTDGGLGDDDLTADGTIVDDGGPGYYIPVGGEVYPVRAVGLMMQLGGLTLILGIGISIAVIRRRYAV